MLGLHGACLFHEWILTFKRQDGLGGHAALRLFPSSVGGVAMIGQVDDVSEVSRVSFSGQAVFMPRRLDPVDNLDRGAAEELRHTRQNMVVVTTSDSCPK